ncbi:MAG TPA: carbohydrate ABC transporter permease [Anaerolineae bacterium]|nr:carbohydrate ABC transporter permease [Anaerolineae bacterium]
MSVSEAAFEVRRFRIDWGKLLWWVMLVLALFAILFPIYIMFKYSIADKASIVTGGKYPEPLWPFYPNVAQFKALFAKKDFVGAGLFSLEIAILTVAFSLIIGAPAAFALARYRFPGMGVLLFLFISIRLFPDIASVIPVTERFLRPPLVHVPTMLQVVMAHALLSIPYVVYICQGVFEAIPKDLEEQAQVMGASRLQAFLNVVIPVALPGMAAAAIYTFLLSWNEFIFAYYLLFQSPANTLPVYMMRLLTWTPQRNFLAALAVILSLPVILFTFLVQRYMIAGMTAGAVK